MKTKNYFFALLLLVISFNSLSQGVQQSFCRSVNIYINQFAYTRDSVLVSLGNSCVVTDVNLKIVNVTHTWDSDLRFYLHKGSTGAMLINYVGGSGDNFVNTNLDDSALIPIASGTAPFTGNFRPFQALAPFNGLGTDGYWRLTILDTTSGDFGTLNGWCVQLTYTCPTGGIQTVEIPNTYMLYQNYPNPFNPVTKIRYGLPKNGTVKLTIYDELGKEVAVLADGYREANTYEAVFDATNLPSGVYYYKLEADGFSDTKKMVIVK
ncbi:MAG: T9SS type A sorting domain-containing protein [Ignavibacteria bacterium]|nr:T9SS type A sorting domain-containing protein [Ignavibacteria bacterium]